MEYFTLNNGIQIPAMGFGVFRMTDLKECEEMVLEALKAGYRLIDTAAAYENEEAVGRAIKRSGIAREELFIVTKLWVTDTNYEKAKAGFEHSLQRLGLDYLDLYVIHQPYNDYYGAWRALEELDEEGKVRAIGIDNFTQDRLADFLAFNKVKPAINLIEVNPYFQREDELVYNTSKDIQIGAWSPFAAGRGNLFNEPILIEIANHYHKSVAQVILRWLYQRNIVSLCKGSSFEHIKQNLEIFDFELSQEDMKEITKLDTKESFFGTRNTAAKVEKFIETARKYRV